MMVSIRLTDAALKRIKKLDKRACCIFVQKGGCFGNTISFSFDSKGEQICSTEGVDLYYQGPQIDENLVIDYSQSLIRSGFIVNAQGSRNCCCNKSFGVKKNGRNCVSELQNSSNVVSV